jgi:hypothetical protein
MVSNSKRVYAAEVSVTYNELVKGLEFHIPSGMTLGEFSDWRKAHAKNIYEALLINTQLENDVCYKLAGMPKAKHKVHKAKGGKNVK